MGEFDAGCGDLLVPPTSARSFEQVGARLYGPLIIEEHDPVRVDRDLTWMLDDWRLGPDGSIRGDFGNRHDMSHNGRVGNTVTINGRAPGDLVVRSGERIRLRPGQCGQCPDICPRFRRACANGHRA